VLVGDIPADTTLEVALKIKLPPLPPQAQLKIDGQLTYRSPAGNLLELGLNPVSLRVVETGQFALRDGVVADVVKQVLEQMQATGVLTYARTSSLLKRAPGQTAQAAAEASVAEVNQYASLLGEAAAHTAALNQFRNLAAMAAAPMAAKAQVASAYIKQRSSKKFD
jgi:hypothetical protein